MALGAVYEIFQKLFHLTCLSNSRHMCCLSIWCLAETIVTAPMKQGSYHAGCSVFTNSSVCC